MLKLVLKLNIFIFLFCLWIYISIFLSILEIFLFLPNFLFFFQWINTIRHHVLNGNDEKKSPVNGRSLDLLENQLNGMYRYYIVRHARASWRSAQNHCIELGGQLYIINTRDHWMTLMDNMLNSGYSPDHVFLAHMIFMNLRPIKKVSESKDRYKRSLLYYIF